MENNYDKDFLQRYLDGECSEQERQKFQNCLYGADEHREVNWIKKIWDKSEKSNDVVLGAEERILQQVLSTINNNPSISDSDKRLKRLAYIPIRYIWSLNPLLRYVAVILAVLIPILLINFFIEKQPIQNQIQWAEKSTHNGQHLTFRLEDGTNVTLNSNSRLKYPITFSDSTRLVTLSGEAFFDVAKDSKRPFTVSTGNISTTALGTSFNILCQKDEPFSKISLITGLVKVEVQNQYGLLRDIQLTPGEELVYKKEDGSFETNVFDYNAVAGWKDGIIYFKEAGIEEIEKRLEAWYDVEIKIEENKNKIKNENWTYTGKFDKQTLENVLRGIGYVKDFSFEINGKKVDLIFN